MSWINRPIRFKQRNQYSKRVGFFVFWLFLVKTNLYENQATSIHSYFIIMFYQL